MAILFRKKTDEVEATQVTHKPPKRQDSWRETAESVVFAFVLAFLFRTFEAEAFVIPTGSMAPTLYGRHKEGTCEQCGYRFAVGASDEVNNDFGYLHPHTRVEDAFCPNCRYPDNDIENNLAFNGDRILVTKYPYEVGEPERFDVFVFKFPEEPKTNYIKRLIGLPNETIRIRNGDVYLFDEEQGERIQRKTDPDKQRQIQIPVYDDDHPPRAILEAGWPERWAAVTSLGTERIGQWEQATAGWTHDADARTFRLADQGAGDGRQHWIRYRHFVPSPDDWDALLAGRLVQARPQLISDFCGYNAYYGRGVHMSNSARDVDTGGVWVADLTSNFELTLDAVEADGNVLIELCDGLSWYRCRIDVNTGQATLLEVNVQMDANAERELATAKTPIQGTGTWDISFANVDDRLCLWVDDSVIDFGEGASYERFEVGGPMAIESDLAPVGIAASNVQAQVAHLQVERDIYYRKTFQERQEGQNHRLDRIMRDLHPYLYDPAEWTRRYTEHLDELNSRDYKLGPDEYLAMGDNSPRSRDSRLWATGAGVPRKFLVGKAFWIYWPHGVPFMNDGRGYALSYHKTAVPNGGFVKVPDYPKYTAPFYPQIERMNRIR
ncbi:MAG: signal peptidase I [Planctomycetaceae bacterium]|nr:signal peptidase I [Planctomycetaceae bacterium]